MAMMTSCMIKTKEIPLNKEFLTIVDDADYEWLNQWHWWWRPKQYVVRNEYIGIINGNPKNRRIIMHRLITDAPYGMEVDHVDGNPLNNTRNNLRIVTKQQNQWNQKIRKFSSQYKGVHWCNTNKKWCSAIRHDGKKLGLGHYASETEAALAYNKAAKKYFGEFARLNEVTA